MSFSVSLTNDAVRDLEEIYEYIARCDSPAKASRILDQAPQDGWYFFALIEFGLIRQIIAIRLPPE